MVAAGCPYNLIAIPTPQMPFCFLYYDFAYIIHNPSVSNRIGVNSCWFELKSLTITPFRQLGTFCQEAVMPSAPGDMGRTNCPNTAGSRNADF